jgi:hypothetical protein
MRRAALVDDDTHGGIPSHDGPDSSCVVEVNVRQQHVRQRVESGAQIGQGLLQSWQTARRPRIHKRGARRAR